MFCLNIALYVFENWSFLRRKMSFNGKVVLITGGGSGIGADAARHLASLGANLSIVDKNEKGLRETAEEIKKSNATVPLQIVADITKDTERIVDETIKNFKQLDILINCAGIGCHDDICSLDFCEFDKIFDVNVRSAVKLTKHCVPHLEKTKGNIINVSSVNGLKKGIQRMLSYAMSKAVVDQFTKCCALDLASKEIRVNAINPAAIRTPIYGTKENEERTDAFCQKILPIGRMGEVSDTTAAITFLASDQTASFLTGVLLPVDGGFMATGKSKADD